MFKRSMNNIVRFIFDNKKLIFNKNKLKDGVKGIISEGNNSLYAMLENSCKALLKVNINNYELMNYSKTQASQLTDILISYHGVKPFFIATHKKREEYLVGYLEQKEGKNQIAMASMNKEVLDETNEEYSIKLRKLEEKLEDIKNKLIGGAI